MYMEHEIQLVTDQHVHIHEHKFSLVRCNWPWPLLSDCILSALQISFYIVVFLLVSFQIEELPTIVRELATGRRTWESVIQAYPIFEQQEATKSAGDS